MQYYKDYTNEKKEEYIKRAVKTILSHRSDLSSDLIHLTREYGGEKAEENLISILKSNKIEARNVDFYLKRELPVHFNDEFKVLSLTETPLNQIKNITDITFRRKVNLEPYGLIFSKDDLLVKGASPVTYLYHESQRDYYKTLFSECLSQGSFNDNLSVFPFLKTVSSTEDFHWEREWKKVGDLDFEGMCFTIIVPSVKSIKEVYKRVYLHHKDHIDFFTLDYKSWGTIHYLEDQPSSIPGVNVKLSTYAEINVWGEIPEGSSHPEILFYDRIDVKDREMNEQEYLIESLGEDIYKEYFSNE